MMTLNRNRNIYGNSQLQRMTELLKKAKFLPKIIEPEQSIFSIGGGRGHWKNPITEILVFLR